MRKLNEIFKVNQTYQTITPESCANGDCDDQGYEFKNKQFSLRDIMYELKNQGVENISNYNNGLDIYGWNYTSDYKTGEETQKCLHVTASNRAIKRLLNLINKGLK